MNLNREGIQSYVLEMLDTYDHSRFQMDICCRGPVIPEDTSRQAKAAGSKILRCKGSRYFLPAAVRFNRLFTQHPYDVIVDHYPIHGWPALWAAKRREIPIRIGVLHGTRVYNQTNIATRAAQWLGLRVAQYLCSQILAVSKATLDVLYPNWHAMEDGFFQIVYLGVNQERFDRVICSKEVRLELTIPASSFVIGHVGGFRKEKNHPFIIECFQKFLRVRKDAYLLLVGDGDQKASVMTQARQLGIQNRVVFTGSRSDVARMYAAMDLFFFPSLFEGFGLVASEASLAGLPVVCSELPAILEGLHPDVRAECSVDIDSIDQTVDNLIRFSTDTELRDRTASLNRQWVRDNFSVKNSVEEFQRLFSESVPTRLS